MVDVRVRAHADDLAGAPAAREAREHGRQRGDAVAGVDEQVAVAPAQVPEVGAQQLVHVRLGEHGRPAGHPREAEPVGGDGELRRRVHAVILPHREQAGATVPSGVAPDPGARCAQVDWPRAHPHHRPALVALLRDQRHALAARHARDARAHADGLGAGDRRRGRRSRSPSCSQRSAGPGPVARRRSGRARRRPLLRRVLLPAARAPVGDLGLVSALTSLQGAYVAVAVDPPRHAGDAAARRGPRPVRRRRGAHVVRRPRQVDARRRLGARRRRDSSPASCSATPMRDIGWLSQSAISRTVSLSIALPLALLSGGIAVPRLIRLRALGAGCSSSAASSC